MTEHDTSSRRRNAPVCQVRGFVLTEPVVIAPIGLTIWLVWTVGLGR